MIALLAVLAAGLVVENVEPESADLSMQVLARVPKLTARYSDAMEALVASLPNDVEGYSRRDMLTVTGGEPIRCEQGPDYIRIAFYLPPENWKSGLSLMEALVKSSRLAPTASVASRKSDAWVNALRPFAHGTAARPNEVSELYRRIFRPENLVLGVGGKFTPGVVREEWTSRMDRWQPERLLPLSSYEPEPKALTAQFGPISTVEFSGKPFGANDAALPTKALALVALGSGKGATLFRIARQKLGLSYRQEAVMYPVTEGWQPRILLETSVRDGLEARADELKKLVLQDIKDWTEADRLRALGMSQAVFLRDVNFSPFAFGPAGSPGDALEDRTFLQTYWQMKVGQPWDAAGFVSAMGQVRLSELKETAAEIISQSSTRILAGR